MHLFLASILKCTLAVSIMSMWTDQPNKAIFGPSATCE